MAVPKIIDSRLYYRCSILRFDEAKVLQKAGFNTGAAYLGGYGIECMLTALTLNTTPKRGRGALLSALRGHQGHDYEWLRTVYLSNGGARFPREVNQHFTLASIWSTDLRYLPRELKPTDASAFLTAAEVIINWA